MSIGGNITVLREGGGGDEMCQRIDVRYQGYTALIYSSERKPNTVSARNDC